MLLYLTALTGRSNGYVVDSLEFLIFLENGCNVCSPPGLWYDSGILPSL